MTTFTRSLFTPTRRLLEVAAIITVVALVALPAIAAAADYAYVDQVGNVRSTTADTWQTAIATAPNIHVNSGVMLLNSANDDILNN
jgi:hypothetical protein